MTAKPVYETIVKLLETFGYATISQLSKLSGVKAAEVLNIVHKNRELMKFSGKQQIIGFNNSRAVYRNPGERWYTTEEINYGAAKKLVVSHPDVCEDLKEHYMCGWLGDSHGISVILYNEDNLKKLHERGYISLKERQTIPFSEQWVE